MDVHNRMQIDPMNRTAELNRIMTESKLTARQVGALLGRDAHTVRNWRSSSDRTIPAHALELLRVKLAAAATGADA